MADSPAWQPLANHIFVAIPERHHAPKGPRSPEGLAITLLSGEDSLKDLEYQLRTGGALQFETEALETERNKVCVGQVLQLPTRLDDQMVLHAVGDRARTFADIAPVVAVGDTVYLDRSCLIDENEILPGVYRVSYAAVICVISNHEITETTSDPQGDAFFQEFWEHLYIGTKPTLPPISKDNPHQPPKTVRTETATLTPVAGYVLLNRVWADDVVYETVEGRAVKCRKVGALITQYNVPPLPNEGVVEWVDAPLRGCGDDLRPGQRVIITPGHALVEDICGTEYLCVRHDYILAVKEPKKLPFDNAAYHND